MKKQMLEKMDCTNYCEGFPIKTPPVSVRMQDDLYAAVNSEWLASTEIPQNKNSVGAFEELTEKVEAKLITDFTEMSSENAHFELLTELLKFYNMASNYTMRNADGAKPLHPYLESIDELNNLSDFNTALPELIINGMSLSQSFPLRMATPLTVYVQADMGDAKHNALYMDMPNLILPDVSYYNLPIGEQLLLHYQESLQKLLAMSGCKEEKAVEIAEQTLAFDRLLKQYAKSAKETMETSAKYNPLPLDELIASSKSIDFTTLVSALVPETPKYVVLCNPKFFSSLDNIFNEENFSLLKGWLYGQMVFSAAPILSEEMMATSESFNMMLMGKTVMDDPQKSAYRLTAATFDGLIGYYYGRAYFSEESRKAIKEMADNIRSVYARRLRENDWLSKETIKAAITKLESMKIHIGYPDKPDPMYAQLQVKEGTLFDNYISFMRVHNIENLRKYGQNVNTDEWIVSASFVNATNHLLSNSIYIPAAILQEPFYSLKYSASRNYGGIGTIIAHEITHAFDSNGARFDQNGSLLHWWTDTDYSAFQERTAAMVTLFDGIPYAGGKVNGELTVTENVSDAGGLSCALEIVKALPDADVQAFFEGWAIIWRFKVTPESEQLLLYIDTHAPHKLRVNVQAQNLDAFYDTFHVQVGDGMYLEPKKRVKIW
jgi:putative endopeptidase